jgi:hypothetical protein
MTLENHTWNQNGSENEEADGVISNTKTSLCIDISCIIQQIIVMDEKQ